jgi:hypothetical protein
MSSTIAPSRCALTCLIWTVQFTSLSGYRWTASCTTSPRGNPVFASNRNPLLQMFRMEHTHEVSPKVSVPERSTSTLCSARRSDGLCIIYSPRDPKWRSRSCCRPARRSAFSAARNAPSLLALRLRPLRIRRCAILPMNGYRDNVLPALVELMYRLRRA